MLSHHWLIVIRDKRLTRKKRGILLIKSCLDDEKVSCVFELQFLTREMHASHPQAVELKGRFLYSCLLIILLYEGKHVFFPSWLMSSLMCYIFSRENRGWHDSFQWRWVGRKNTSWSLSKQDPHVHTLLSVVCIFILILLIVLERLCLKNIRTSRGIKQTFHFHKEMGFISHEVEAEEKRKWNHDEKMMINALQAKHALIISCIKMEWNDEGNNLFYFYFLCLRCNSYVILLI